MQKRNIIINHKNHYSKQLNKWDIDSFEGNWETSSIGKCTDFNLMTTGNTFGDLSLLKLIEGKFSWWRLGLLPVFLLLGLFSKENAILLIPVVLLLEVLWFQFAGPDGKIIPVLRNLSCSLIVIGLLGAVTAVLLRWEWWQAKFRWRPFTLEERLLTESRILWDYVAQ